MMRFLILANMVTACLGSDADPPSLRIVAETATGQQACLEIALWQSSSEARGSDNDVPACDGEPYLTQRVTVPVKPLEQCSK